MQIAFPNLNRRFYRRPLREEGGDVLAIHTGLTVTICGHEITLDRDEDAKVACVVVNVIEGHVVTGLEAEAVRAAAALHARKAQRFLGHDWTVVPWDGGIESVEMGA
jgi:hypothetical protein